jgi:hypothetical protein
MSTDPLAEERRKQRRLERLGCKNPVCSACPEADWRCLELHHLAEEGRDPFTVILCSNCHRKVSDAQKDHAPAGDVADPFLDAIGYFLRGLAETLRLIADKLVEFGLQLIERAKAQPAQAEGAAS